MTEFDKLYRAYFSDVFLYIRNLSGDANIAEEIASETFFKAMRAIDQFRGDCEIRVWLCQIAKNTYFSYLRKHKRIADLDELEAVDHSPSRKMEDNVALQDEAGNLHAAVHVLPEPYKEVFMLRVFGQMSYEQIGKLFSKTQNWACVTFYRAKKKILSQMEDQANEE